MRLGRYTVIMKPFFLIFIVLSFSKSFAQDIDNEYQTTPNTHFTTQAIKSNPYNLKLKQVVVPATFIGYGLLALNNKELKSLNKSAKRSFKQGETYYTTSLK